MWHRTKYHCSESDKVRESVAVLGVGTVECGLVQAVSSSGISGRWLRAGGQCVATEAQHLAGPGGILLGAVIHVSLMANSHKSPYTSTSTSTVELVPYRDELPMTTPRLDDSPLPALRSPGLTSDADAALPPHLRFRSTVPLLPTPGTISKRHPSYVRRRSTCVD